MRRLSRWLITLSLGILASTSIGAGCELFGPSNLGNLNANGGNTNTNDNANTNTNDNTANDNADNTNDNTGNTNNNTNNNSNDNTGGSQTLCDAAFCAGCDAASCLSITRVERFANGGINVSGINTCDEDLLIDWYKIDGSYLVTYFAFPSGSASELGKFDGATGPQVKGYQVRKADRADCQCADCPTTAIPPQ